METTAATGSPKSAPQIPATCAPTRTDRRVTSGWTGNQQIPYAKSIMDYIFRWLGAKFLGPEYAVTEAGETNTLRPTEPIAQQDLPFTPVVTDAPLCSECGSIMTRNGSCYKCGNCGGTSGCS